MLVECKKMNQNEPKMHLKLAPANWSGPQCIHCNDTAIYGIQTVTCTWWRNQMETFSALLAICAGNSLVAGELPAQRPVTPSFDVFFDLRLNKRSSKQSWGWWFEMPSPPFWRHCNVNIFSGRGCLFTLQLEITLRYSFRGCVVYFFAFVFIMLQLHTAFLSFILHV